MNQFFRLFILTLILLPFTRVMAQEGYAVQTKKALKVMSSAKDPNDYKMSLDMYEKAFASFPDSIDYEGLYNASISASELNLYDKAFGYINGMKRLQKDAYGFPWWDYIACQTGGEDYKHLMSDRRWRVLLRDAVKEKEMFYRNLEKEKKEFFALKEPLPFDNKNIKPLELYKKLKCYNAYLTKERRNYSIIFDINDSTRTSYFVHLPPHYNPDKKYSLLFFLHGAVRYNALVDFQTPEVNLGDWNRFYTKYADKDDVILAFPKGNREYNWMTPDNGFFMVPAILRQIKQALNIDDSKVFISGHSNGATGSFSYLMKQPTDFVACYGFNTYPKVFTGGTFVQNIMNRAFIAITTDQDYYYPPEANDDLTKLMKSIQADYQEHRYNGYPHSFPQYDESEAGIKILFEDMKKRSRISFPSEISWEFDDDKYVSVDWIMDAKLDTLKSPQAWQAKPLNFKIKHWLVYNKQDSLIKKDVEKCAFDFPRKSGKVKATYRNNEFQIEASCLKSLSINISPEMVNMNKPIKIYIDGKLRYNHKVVFDKEFMRQNFEKNRDRDQLWVNQIRLNM